MLVANPKTFAGDERAMELTRSTYRGNGHSVIVHSARKKNPVLTGTTNHYEKEQPNESAILVGPQER